jgi:hypothetical protein
MIQRPEDWPDLLAAHLTYWRSQPFEWGKGDCAHFAASWLTQLGYKQPLAGLPSWDSALSAARVFNALGGFEHAVQAQMVALECPEIPKLYAMRGDLAIVWIDERRQALGIVNGKGVAVRYAEAGVTEINYINNAVRAWRL